jgi:hypothetical protein
MTKTVGVGVSTITTPLNNTGTSPFTAAGAVAGLPPGDPVPQRPLRGYSNDEHFRAEGFLSLL